MGAITTIGGEATRIDLDVLPGEAVDFTVPVLDSAGEVQDVTGWTAAAQIRANHSAPVLHTFTLTADEDGVRVTAAEGDTATWADWSSAVARWDLWVTPPAGSASQIVAGWVRVHSTITH